MTPPRLGVAFDATACLGATTGIGRFAAEALAGLGRDPDLDLSVFAVTWRGRNDLDAITPPGARIVSRPMAARPLHEVWSRFDRPVIEWWTGPIDVVHGPNYVVPPTRRAARVVTVHDLTPLRFPELADAHTRRFPTLIERAVRRGAWVHTSSGYVADEVIEHFPIEPDRVVVVPGGVTPLPAQSEDSSADAGRRLVGADRYVLALGTVEPRKDLPALVSAFDLVAADEPAVRLVIAGADGWGAQELVHAVDRSQHSGRIMRLGRVSETQRAALLRGATVLAYPSRYEGFGLPPLEAMDAGVPVVCTDAGSLPEVVGDAALLVSAELLGTERPEGIIALADALRSVLTDASLRARLEERGRARAAKFRWSDTAAGFADLYRRAAAAR